MCQRDGFAVSLRAEQSIPNVAVANLFAFNLRNVKNFLAVRPHQTEVDSWRRLKLHFEKLVADIRKTPVIPIILISKTLADKPMKHRTTISFLTVTDVGKGISN